VELQVGKTGQFDVLADGEVVATKGSGLWAKLLGGGWPDEEDVVGKLRARLAK
jgi:hypothetical protein